MSIVSSIKQLFGFKNGLDPLGDQGFSPLGSDNIVDENKAMTVSAFWRGVSYIATNIASMNTTVVKKDKRINKITDQNRSHRIAKLFNYSPNDIMSGYTFMELIAIYACNWGNFYAEIEFNNAGKPIKLWPIKPNRVDPFVKDGKIYYRVVHGCKKTANHLILPAWKVFHVKGLGDGVKGVSVAQMAKRSLQVTIHAEEFELDFYKNKALPSGVLMFDKPLLGEARINVKSSWREHHGGRRSGGTAILDNGGKYESINMPFSDMQFLESRRFSLGEIARWLSVPPAKLYDRQDVKNDSAENEHIYAMSDAVSPWVSRIEAEANFKLLDSYKTDYELDIKEQNLYRFAPLNIRSAYVRDMIKSSTLNPNEARALDGRMEIEGGDRYFIEANNLTPLDRVDDEINSRFNNQEGSSVSQSE